MGSRPDRRAFCLMAAVAAASATVARVALAAEDNDLARAVKATYLYKFAPFVMWPDGAFASPRAPLPICVVGDPALADLVARAVAGLQVDEHSLTVRQLTTIEHDSDCRILYVGSPHRASVAQVLETVRGRPVLTITDSAHGEGARGVIHFLVHAGRVRFEIDARLARENGLTISSRVLELALRVKRTAEQDAGPVPS